jgi:hypothetical protein
MKRYWIRDAKEAIQLLKEKQAFELVQLKDQYHVTYESLQPVNLIKMLLDS